MLPDIGIERVRQIRRDESGEDRQRDAQQADDRCPEPDLPDDPAQNPCPLRHLALLQLAGSRIATTTTAR
ncbi:MULTISPECIES: hypothetical protein [unclassified Sphingomonas]|uniref:hypothetical protein n=1 Tax=unclassified Sphingomonas TaxID=196159 RepID=UPI001F38C612|nr:hypothetical protein [Sphingomonas sp. FUKUSWIS1]MDY1007542.1 hypothetical protein [Sphingomonas sp. CFBP9019]